MLLRVPWGFGGPTHWCHDITLYKFLHDKGPRKEEFQAIVLCCLYLMSYDSILNDIRSFTCLAARIRSN